MFKHLKTLVFLALSLSPKLAWAQGADFLRDRFSVVGVISDNNREKRNSSIAVVFDKQARKNLILRVGDKLPGYSSFSVLAILTKQVKVGDYGNEVLLDHDVFANGSDTVASSGAKRGIPEEFDDDFDDSDDSLPPPAGYNPDDDFDDDDFENQPPPPPPRGTSSNGAIYNEYGDGFVNGGDGNGGRQPFVNTYGEPSKQGAKKALQELKGKRDHGRGSDPRWQPE